jgi:hypothetical protein
MLIVSLLNHSQGARFFIHTERFKPAVEKSMHKTIALYGLN